MRVARSRLWAPGMDYKFTSRSPNGGRIRRGGVFYAEYPISPAEYPYITNCFMLHIRLSAMCAKSNVDGFKGDIRNRTTMEITPYCY